MGPDSGLTDNVLVNRPHHTGCSSWGSMRTRLSRGNRPCPWPSWSRRTCSAPTFASRTATWKASGGPRPGRDRLGYGSRRLPLRQPDREWADVAGFRRVRAGAGGATTQLCCMPTPSSPHRPPPASAPNSRSWTALPATPHCSSSQQTSSSPHPAATTPNSPNRCTPSSHPSRGSQVQSVRRRLTKAHRGRL